MNLNRGTGFQPVSNIIPDPALRRSFFKWKQAGSLSYL